MIGGAPDIITVMEREGIELRRRGRDFWAPCPFHADKSPSFKVSPERNSFHCFSCGEHGDAMDFIMKRRGISFKEALRVLGIKKGRMPRPDPAEERRRQLKQAYERWLKIYYLQLCDRAIELHSLRISAMKRETPLPEYLAFFVAEQLSELPLIEYRLDILMGQDAGAKFELFEEVMSRD